MSNPIIADNKPVKVNLSTDQAYHFCTCGRSSSQPFCDGSHAGTEFTHWPAMAWRQSGITVRRRR
jgi:CDGSH-type Zn-finger protein